MQLAETSIAVGAVEADLRRRRRRKQATGVPLPVRPSIQTVTEVATGRYRSASDAVWPRRFVSHGYTSSFGGIDARSSGRSSSKRSFRRPRQFGVYDRFLFPGQVGPAQARWNPSDLGKVIRIRATRQESSGSYGGALASPAGHPVGERSGSDGRRAQRRPRFLAVFVTTAPIVCPQRPQLPLENSPACQIFGDAPRFASSPSTRLSHTHPIIR